MRRNRKRIVFNLFKIIIFAGVLMTFSVWVYKNDREAALKWHDPPPQIKNESELNRSFELPVIPIIERIECIECIESSINSASDDIIPDSQDHNQYSGTIELQVSQPQSTCPEIISRIKSKHTDISPYFKNDLDVFAIEESTGRNAFHYLAEFTERPDVWVYDLERIIERIGEGNIGLLLNAQDREGNTPLHRAFFNESVKYKMIHIYTIFRYFNSYIDLDLENSQKHTVRQYLKFDDMSYKLQELLGNPNPDQVFEQEINALNCKNWAKIDQERSETQQ